MPHFKLTYTVDKSPILTMKKPSVLIQLPTEPSYWGQTVTETSVSIILDNLEHMIIEEFSHRFDLKFERTAMPRGTGVHGEDEDACVDVFHFIELNWTMAL